MADSRSQYVNINHKNQKPVFMWDRIAGTEKAYKAGWRKYDGKAIQSSNAELKEKLKSVVKKKSDVMSVNIDPKPSSVEGDTEIANEQENHNQNENIQEEETDHLLLKSRDELFEIVAQIANEKGLKKPGGRTSTENLIQFIKSNK